jgi:hypothetical protein
MPAAAIGEDKETFMPVCGPSGGGSGGAFNDEPFLEAGTRVVRVLIRMGALVDSVQITHERRDGSLLDLTVGEHS